MTALASTIARWAERSPPVRSEHYAHSRYGFLHVLWEFPVVVRLCSMIGNARRARRWQRLVRIWIGDDFRVQRAITAIFWGGAGNYDSTST